MTPCPQCRMPIPPGATACPNCGTFIGAPHGFAQPPAPPGYAPPGYAPPGQAPPGYAPPGQAPPGYAPPGQAPPGYGPPGQAPPGYGPPGQAPPPGYGPAGQAPPGHPPVGAAAPSGDSGTGLKVLGGCGVAGCLGAALAGVAMIGLIVLLVALGDSSSSGGGAGGPSGGALPASGSLRDLVRPTVGRYRLISTAQITKIGDRIAPGVVDSLGAFYRSPDGSQLTQVLLAYPSQSVAEARMQAVYDVALQTLEPGQKLTRGEIRNSQGALLGSSLAITGGALEHVYWSNGKLLTFATASPPNAVDYQAASPY
jgi:hypothetical protein